MNHSAIVTDAKAFGGFARRKHISFCRKDITKIVVTKLEQYRISSSEQFSTAIDIYYAVAQSVDA